MNPKDVGRYQKWFKDFIANELDAWIPKGFSVKEISFSIGVSAEPMGIGVSGSVEVSLIKP